VRFAGDRMIHTNMATSTFSSLLGVSAIVDDCEGHKNTPPVPPIAAIIEAKLLD
jgi:hypothetical protein